MITAREVSYGLFGAWRLAHLDRRGMEYFDTSIDGFWRSFWAAAWAMARSRWTPTTRP